MARNWGEAPASDKTPAAIAVERLATLADGMATPAECDRFLTEFSTTLFAIRKGLDTESHWRAIQDDSFKVAGFIEAASAARRGRI
jgi:hypothetical protein